MIILKWPNIWKFMSRPRTSAWLKLFINYLLAKVLVVDIRGKYVCVSGGTFSFSENVCIWTKWMIPYINAPTMFQIIIEDLRTALYFFLILFSVINHFMPLVSFRTLENIRKPLVFWCFQGVEKKISAWNGSTRNTFCKSIIQ